MSLTPEQYAVVLERAADECMDARSFDEWTGTPRGGNAILESDAAHLRALAKAMREAEPTLYSNGQHVINITLPEAP